MPCIRSITLALIPALIFGPLAGLAHRRTDPPVPPLTLTTGPAAAVSLTGGTVARVKWRVPAPAQSIDQGPVCVLYGPPGEYLVTAVVPDAGDAAIYQLTVRIPGAVLGPTDPAPGPAPTPAAAAGKAYRAAMGRAYSSAWGVGANALEAGKGMDAALQAVSAAWALGRADQFEQAVAPIFRAIVPDATADKDITADQRAALVSAWRDFAKGLVTN